MQAELEQELATQKDVANTKMKPLVSTHAKLKEIAMKKIEDAKVQIVELESHIVDVGNLR
jgi:hypothetical protein